MLLHMGGNRLTIDEFENVLQRGRVHQIAFGKLLDCAPLPQVGQKLLVNLPDDGNLVGFIGRRRGNRCGRARQNEHQLLKLEPRVGQENRSVNRIQPIKD